MQRLFFLERHNFRVVPRKDNQNLLERPARWSLKCCVMLVAIVQVKVVVLQIRCTRIQLTFDPLHNHFMTLRIGAE